MPLHTEIASLHSNAPVAAMLQHIPGMPTGGLGSLHNWSGVLLPRLHDAEPKIAPAADQPLKSGFAPWQIRRLREYVENGIGSALRIETAARMVKFSRSHFCRCFKISFGESFISYVQRQRVRHAQHLMLNTREPLSQIAVICGFADQPHFTRSFGRHVGQSPSAWRRVVVQSGARA